MKSSPIKIVFLILILCMGSALLFWGAGYEMVVVFPKGWVGLEQRNLMVIATMMMLLVVIPVFALTAYITWKYRASNKSAKYTPEWGDNTLAEIIWWGSPFVIVVILSIITWVSTHKLDPYKSIGEGIPSKTIQVVALDWKWLFIYPEEKIATVNFLQFPAKMPIRFEISADAPMNSFWIPDLGGQIFAMAGMKTLLHLVADEPGEYRGCSANLSGSGFSGMRFTAKASSEEEFQSWVKEVKANGSALNISSYQELAKQSKENPVTYYNLEEPELFEWVVMKDMMPPNGEHSHHGH